jgi:hypothetical protein
MAIDFLIELGNAIVVWRVARAIARKCNARRHIKTVTQLFLLITFILNATQGSTRIEVTLNG